MRRRFFLQVGALGAGTVMAGGAAARDKGGRDGPEDLPDLMKLRFSLPDGGRFFPRELIVFGPRRAVAARLPAEAAPRRANRAPVAALPAIGRAFEERPYLDRIGPKTRIGAAHRRGETLIAALESDDAFEAALSRARQAVALIARAPRSRRLIAFTPKVVFEPIERGRALAGPMGGPIGEAHAAAGAFVLAPPKDQLPRFDLF